MEHLGVNKMGKNIRKSPPLHQPNFGNSAKQKSQPQVYNISKNDFRNIVQQLTGSPSHDPLPRPHNNPPKPPSMRLQKIRPPPLTPINPPQIPLPAPAPQYSNSFARPPQHGQFLASGESNSIWASTAESPISAYMRYLIDSGPRQMTQAQPSSSGLLPNPPIHAFPSPQGNNFPPLLPSPTSQFLLPSPSFYSSGSPYPLLSPGFQYPHPPLTPNFPFSPIHHQSGILGPAPQPPPSPGFFPISSPRWRGH